MTISATSGGSAAQPNLPGDKPAILQLGPLYQPAQQRVEQLFRVHKYWLADAAGRSAMLAGPARDCRAVLTNGFFGVDNAIMDALPALQMVSYGTVGYDRIDVARAVARGIRITNTPGVLNDAVTELAIGMLISAARRRAIALCAPVPGSAAASRWRSRCRTRSWASSAWDASGGPLPRSPAC
jgi:hypothetical protein